MQLAPPAKDDCRVQPSRACPPRSYPWVRACLTRRKDSTDTPLHRIRLRREHARIAVRAQAVNATPRLMLGMVS